MPTAKKTPQVKKAKKRTKNNGKALINFQADVELKRRAARIARENGVNLSHWLRQAVASFCEKYEPTNGKTIKNPLRE